MTEKEAKADMANLRYYLTQKFKHLLIMDRFTFSHAMVKILMRTPKCTVKFVGYSSPNDMTFHVLYNTVTGKTQIVFPPIKLDMMGTVKLLAQFAIVDRERAARRAKKRKNIA